MHRRFLETEPSMPPSNEHNKFIGDGNFDANMVIVLGALLCALICTLGLNSIAKCFIRCRRSFSQETPARLTGRGLKKRDLSQIPVTVYGSSENVLATECPICLGEFENGDRVRMLPKCNHGFHVRCIDAWLVSHSSCPICRHSILEKQQQTTVSEVAGDGLPDNEAGRRGDLAVVVEQAS